MRKAVTLIKLLLDGLLGPGGLVLGAGAGPLTPPLIAWCVCRLWRSCILTRWGQHMQSLCSLSQHYFQVTCGPLIVRALSLPSSDILPCGSSMCCLVSWSCGLPQSIHEGGCPTRRPEIWIELQYPRLASPGLPRAILMPLPVCMCKIEEAREVSYLPPINPPKCGASLLVT